MKDSLICSLFRLGEYSVNGNQSQTECDPKDVVIYAGHAKELTVLSKLEWRGLHYRGLVYWLARCAVARSKVRWNAKHQAQIPRCGFDVGMQHICGNNVVRRAL